MNHKQSGKPEQQELYDPESIIPQYNHPFRFDITKPINSSASQQKPRQIDYTQLDQQKTTDDMITIK